MRRRDFLTHALVGGAALTACGGGRTGEGGPAVHSGQRVRWRLASSFPRSLDTLWGASEVLAERVAAMTDGQFEIRCYPAGELVPGLAVMDAVQQGTVQIGQTASYYYIGKHPALAFETTLPFGLTARQQTAWLEQAGGRELMDDLLAEFGIKSLPSGNTGVQMGGWFVPEVRSVDDLKGLKMRIPGNGGRVMETLGVATQTIAGGEIFPALERGAIDATDWVGPYDDEKLGFQKVAKNYYYPGWWEPGPSLAFYVGKAAWDALPAGYQAVLRAASAEASTTMQMRYDALNPPALERLVAAGVTTRPFTQDLMDAARASSRQLLADQAAADPVFRKIHEHWDAFRTASFQWFSLAELAYQADAFARP
ncbi:MAG: TRAP transporter substrate-binding protein [Alphaproteobacteria bacterium]|nr:TRAP transporter substrate-binding protein [Alphaproteobacteria bacterium]